MGVMFEKIEYIQKRTGATFEVVEKSLKKAKGDTEKAIYLINKRERSKIRRCVSIIMNSIIGLFRYKFIIKKNDVNFVNLPLMIILIIVIPIISSYNYTAPIVSIYVFIIILLTGSEITIKRNDPNVPKIKLKTIEVVNEDDVLEEHQEEQVVNDEGFNKVEIE